LPLRRTSPSKRLPPGPFSFLRHRWAQRGPSIGPHADLFERGSRLWCVAINGEFEVTLVFNRERWQRMLPETHNERSHSQEVPGLALVDFTLRGSAVPVGTVVLDEQQ